MGAGAEGVGGGRCGEEELSEFFSFSFFFVHKSCSNSVSSPSSLYSLSLHSFSLPSSAWLIAERWPAC